MREERPRYLLKCRGRGRVVTQRNFGPTRSLAARSAATLKVAASRAAHEHLSPTGGRAKRVARMGRSGGYEVGKGRAEKPRHGCEVAGRAQAGGANTTYVQGHCARARVGGARTFRLDLALLARRQRQDVVDPEGHEVRGRGECPDPPLVIRPGIELNWSVHRHQHLQARVQRSLASAGGRLSTAT